MQRYEIEEAVAQTNQLLHTLRGIEGLTKVCEAALNATQVVDSLKETQDKLLAEIDHIKKSTDEALVDQERQLARQRVELDKSKSALLDEIKGIAMRRDKMNTEFEQAKILHNTKMQDMKNELETWMADCAAKQRVANDHLTAVTAQLDAILAARGR